MRNIMLSIILVLLGLSFGGPAVAGNGDGPSIVVHFDSGKANLSAGEKAKLRQLFQTYDVTGAGRVFVLGYTDSQGAQNRNYVLSRKRAQTVRREIISAFGVNATVVISMGKGPENPVADNGRDSGRAQNRRVEIYLANAVVRRPKRVYGPEDTHLSAITTLVNAADALVRERRIEQALKKLQQAHAIGGDHYSDWHTVMGIAGFYAGASQAKSHLATAVQLDPYNFKAREYLSRLQARHQVTSGKINTQMGLSPQDAIPVTALVQAHEYLQLFGVQPIAHQELESQPIQVWQCQDDKGRAVSYHFNHAPVYAWAFDRQAAALSTPSELVGQPEKPSTRVSPPPDSAPSRQQIWESKIFK